MNLEDIASVSGGHAFKSSQYVDSGVFVLRTVNIDDNYAIVRGNDAYISEGDAKNYSRFELQEHDTLFVMVAATLGKIGYVRKENTPALLNQNMWVIRAKESSVDPVYLHYLFRQLSKPIIQYKSGSARGFLRRDDVRKIPVNLPVDTEQNNIGKALKSLDDKIDLNRQMNATLEAMTKAIFKDWFVDFGPSLRKSQGETDPIKTLGGLITDPAKASKIAALFPNSLGDSGLPIGWVRGTLADIAKESKERAKPESINPQTPYIGLEHMPRNSISLGEWETAEKISSTKSVFTKGQILFGKLRPYFHKVGLAPIDGICSTDIVVLDGKRETDRSLICSLCSSTVFVDYNTQASSGTRMPRTKWSIMGAYPIAISSEIIRDAYSEIVSPIHNKIFQAIEENQTLAETRDCLLPKLMSGEVRVGDAA